MGMKNALAPLTLLVLLTGPCCSHVGFVHEDHELYATAFPTLEAASHDVSRPASLLEACAGQPVGAATLPEIVITETYITASAAQQQCGLGSTCVVPDTSTLIMDGNLNVGALVVRGSLRWDDGTQQADVQWLCAGFIAVEGTLELIVSNRTAFVYIKENGAIHHALGVRGIGGIGASSLVNIRGRPLQRSWSLLAEPAAAGATELITVHEPSSMGWRVGDRLVLAPTTSGSSGLADATRIKAFHARNVIELETLLGAAYKADFVGLGEGRGGVPLSAEVLNLDRNVIITGDPLRLHEPCPAEYGSLAMAGSPSCTVGLHVAQLWGGQMRIEHTRVERCGQRGIVGKYCLHWHLVGHCPHCSFSYNAIEHGHQCVPSDGSSKSRWDGTAGADGTAAADGHASRSTSRLADVASSSTALTKRPCAPTSSPTSAAPASTSRMVMR